MADDVANPGGLDLVRALPVLLINLDGSAERLKKASSQLAAAGISFERLPAVDGRLLPESERSRIAPWDRKAFFKPLSPGEIGCYLSHLAALERIVKEGWPRALVLEDDFILTPEFPARLREMLEQPGAVPPLVKFEGACHGGKVERILPSGMRIMINRRAPSRTIAQLWSLAGARTFLANTSLLRRPVDVEIKHWWETGVEVRYVSPAPIKDGDATGVGSTIGARNPSDLASRFRKAQYRLGFFFESTWRHLRR
ncbi:MAG: glycosyltransferase family 25 protein [Verrucomicrobia bacterium]|nr:glycosyltransferase family 25 protein [Verrucomicrobiota bacterium]